MIYLVGYKIIKTNNKKKYEIVYSRKAFIQSNKFNDTIKNEKVIFQLIQDIDFHEKMDNNTKINLALIMLKNKNINKRESTQLAISYSANMLKSYLKNTELENIENTTLLCKFEITMKDLLNRFESVPYINFKDAFSLEYIIKSKLIYPYKQQLYSILNHNNSNNNIRSLPFEIIDKIINYLGSNISINFMCISQPDSCNSIICMTPCVHLQKDILTY